MDQDQTAPKAIIVDPDQTEQSDLGPHCLSMRLKLF